MRAIRDEQQQESSQLIPARFLRHNSNALQAHPVNNVYSVPGDPCRGYFRLGKLYLSVKILSRRFLSSVRNRSRQLHSSSPLASRFCSGQVRQASACWRRRRISVRSRLLSNFLRIGSISSLRIAFPHLQSETISNKPEPVLDVEVTR